MKVKVNGIQVNYDLSGKADAAFAWFILPKARSSERSATNCTGAVPIRRVKLQHLICS